MTKSRFCTGNATALVFLIVCGAGRDVAVGRGVAAGRDAAAVAGSMRGLSGFWMFLANDTTRIVGNRRISTE